MRLLLIRHGQTPDNVAGALGTLIPGPALTDLGIEQAASLPDALAGLNIEAIYVSTMQRTSLTAAPLADALGLKVQVLDGLREITAGHLEGKSDPDSIRTYMGTIFTWWTSFDARIPGGEDGTEFYARFNGAIETVAKSHMGPDMGTDMGTDADMGTEMGTGTRAHTVAVVSHGAAIRAWTAWASANLDADFVRTHPLENTAVVTLEGTPQTGWVAVNWAGSPVGGEQLEDAGAPDPTGSASQPA
jgi:broad specificity phosphatase PhoE